jgi:hypothetical protein
LIDEFLAAYEHRDMSALKRLVSVPSIHDTSAVAHAQRADFGSLEDWAEAGWAAGDRLGLTGYSAFAGSKDGFTMWLIRRNDGLQDAEIDEVSMLLHARSTGCLIDELGSIGRSRLEERRAASTRVSVTTRRSQTRSRATARTAPGGSPG